MSESSGPKPVSPEALRRAEAILFTNEMHAYFKAREDAKPLPIAMVRAPAEPGPVVELPEKFKSDAKRRSALVEMRDESGESPSD